MNQPPIKFIYWFAYYNLDSPSVRYRAKYPLEFFRKKYGVESFLVLPGYSARRIFLFLKAYFSALLFRKPHSLIVIQRVHSNFIYVFLLKFLIRVHRKNTVYDLDDAEYLRFPARTIHFFTKNCHQVSVGSTAIGEYLSRFNKNIRHTTSPIVDLGMNKTKKNSLFTIGWIGGFGWGHRESLINLVFPALQALQIDFRLVFIGIDTEADRRVVVDFFKEKNNIQLEIPLQIDWNNEDELQKQICAFDIGIATLSDTEYHRAKSGIKAKQYLNNGVPVLSTNLPENNKVVVDGKNGFFCDSPSDFKSRIEAFYEMEAAVYAQFCKNARASVCGFDHERYFEEFSYMKE